MTQPPDPLTNATPAAKISTMALISMILGILSIPLLVVLIGPLVGLVALTLGIISLIQISKDPAHVAGKGFALTGIVTGIFGLLLLPGIVAVLLPSIDRVHNISNSSSCAANLTGIAKAMVVYANENNDQFPISAPPTSPWSYSAATGIASSFSNADDAAKETSVSSTVAGNPAACLWILVNRNSIPAKALVCKSDPYGSSTASPLTTASSTYLLTPAAANQLSYSMIYPWVPAPANRELERPAGKSFIPSSAWKSNIDSTLPILSDMAVLQGTGRPPHRYVPGASPKEINSNNHGADGQNVAYGDAHVEWQRTPAAGQDGEWIFTSGDIFTSTGSTTPGTAPTPGHVTPLNSTSTVTDTVMVPARNVDNGKIE